MRLNRDFYTRPNVTEIARELIGKVLYTNLDGQITAGAIIETEAYSGRNDKACHANDNRRTSRTEIMYAEGGKVYMYLCYGIHCLFNIVTNERNVADAVLVRAIQPLVGLEIMAKRRNTKNNVANGPGKLSQALGLNLSHYGQDLLGKPIWVEDAGIKPAMINTSKRIGVDYAGEDAEKEWRYFIQQI